MKKSPKKNLTLAELGRQLNLTPRAVSQALNGKDCSVRISEATRQRVQKLARELNYRPNRTAQTLRTGKSGLIGLITLRSLTYVMQEQLHFGCQILGELGYIPSIHLIPDESRESMDRAVHLIIDAKLDGVLAFSAASRALARRSREIPVPLVTVGAPISADVPNYHADKKSGYKMLTRHMIDQGCADLVLLLHHETADKGANWPDWCALQGVREAVRQARRENRKATVRIHAPQVTYDGMITHGAPHVHGLYGTGYIGMKEILRTGPLPDAVICREDNLAQGALLACREAGLRVPEDLLISGFENTPSGSAGFISLTTVDQPHEEMCRLALADLKKMLTNEAPLKRHSAVLPCHLILRESSQRKK